MPDEHLRRLGAELAADPARDISELDRFDFEARHKENARRIAEAFRSANDAQAAGEMITPAAQWLLDNFYVVEEAITQIRRDLPRRFYAELPTVRLKSGKSVPRVLTIAWSYVAHTDSSVQPDALAALVDGYQSAAPLSIGELWALPSLLRFVLVENLRRLSVRVDRARTMRRIANDLADRLALDEAEGRLEPNLSVYAEHAQDPTFATQLIYRLRDGSRSAGTALAWLEKELVRRGTSTEAMIQTEHGSLSAGNVTVGNIIKGLRRVDDQDWQVWFERVSRVDALLRRAGNYADLDFNSRDQYRAAVEDIAKRTKLSEVAVAERAVQLSRGAAVEPRSRANENLPPEGPLSADIGAYLIGPLRKELERSLGCKPGFRRSFHRFYRSLGAWGVMIPVGLIAIAFLWFGTLALRGARLSDVEAFWLLLLFAFPAVEGAVGLFNTIALMFIKPSRLVGYEFKDGVPADSRTLVVVPTLIGSRADVEESVHTLEVHYLANMRGELYFALLSDWPDSREEKSQADADLLDYARQLVANLNSKYPMGVAARFHILHRRRLFNEQEGRWMGWERKRGKLHELNLLLRGDGQTTFFPPEPPLPTEVVYVVTLDADTRMTRDAAVKLVGKLSHPLNRPVLDERTGVVKQGYGILQPRVTASLTVGDEASFFQRVFSANRGLDPYVFAVSDVYQDVFGEGTFTGKGIYHVDAFEAALKGRIAENTVLSHDLLEGSFARAGLVTDVEVVEDYPTAYAVDASRHHRWARGDWQLLPFMTDFTLGFSGLSRWKMYDNLRRTLTPILWIAAAIAGWSMLPLAQSTGWLMLLIVMLFVAPTLDILNAIMPRSNSNTLKGHVAALGRDIAFGSAMVALRVCFLAHSAWMMGDAILRTVYRMFISRRNMLEWRTASQAASGARDSVRYYYSMMFGSVVVAFLTIAIPLAAGSTGAYVAALFAAFWAVAPAFAWFVSRSAAREDAVVVTQAEKAKLRNVARRTWRYFEQFATAEHNWMPPDNFQETPAPVVAARTSTTNIGMYLLSVVAARDFGWISLGQTVERISDTLDTMDRLERFRGHFYNWYETRTLKPLQPTYISAVDSGNLAGHLIAIASALNEWAEAPAAYLQGDFQGILDTVEILDECLAALPDDRRPLRPLRKRLAERIDGMRRAVDTIVSEPETAAFRMLNLSVLAGDIRRLCNALNDEIRNRQSAALADWAGRLGAVCEAHVGDAHIEADSVERLRLRLRETARRARTFAFEMDFSFLLNRDRMLLSIGFRVQDKQLDEACYDLLASEARLASLFAIAKGDVPTEHWFQLGRPVVQIGFRGALMSWSGSMFEYLMPPLVMKEPAGGILAQTSELVIRRQIEYARSKRMPWGISEAAYNARDRDLTYQYTNFGVPGLGLKRGLGLNAVIAPYATMLASQFLPHEACENLARLDQLGAMGAYGYYDAVDFTPARVPDGQECAVVYNYMAHHQGMSIVAAANIVYDGRIRDRFHADPVIEASELLLQEKAPRDIPVATIRSDIQQSAPERQEPETSEVRRIADPANALRAVSIMSGGRYSVMLTGTGSGYSRFDDCAITRWHPDSSEDRSGTFFFLRDVESGNWWSATTEPGGRKAEKNEVWMTDAKTAYISRTDGIRTEVECIVVGEGFGEARRVTLLNEGVSDRFIEVTSYSELVLGPAGADDAHPAFSKMFVETRIDRERGAIFARRRARAPGNRQVAIAHFVTGAGNPADGLEAETCRRAFIGRGRTIASPGAMDQGAVLEGKDGFTLDPIVSLRRRIRVPSGRKISLSFWTIAGDSYAEVEAAMSSLDHAEAYERQVELAWTRSQVQTRHVGLSLADAANVEKLARYLVYPDRALRSTPEFIASGLKSQSTLWPMSISGDFPILALRISDQADLELVGQALRMHELLRARGLIVDFVVVNEQAASYVQDLQVAIESLCENARRRGNEHGPRQHIFAVRRDLMDQKSYETLLACAHVVLHTRNGRIEDQIERAEAVMRRVVLDLQAHAATSEPEAAATAPDVAPAPAGDGLTLWNGYGGFDGSEYVVRLDGARTTPQPWINVVANPGFGFHVSAEGAAFTWSRNSRDFAVTPWSNDPVVNRPGEGLYVRDMETGELLSPFSAMLPSPGARYEARHRPGASVFAAARDTLTLKAELVVDPKDPVRITRLSVTNSADTSRRLRVYAYAEWVLSSSRWRAAPMIVPGRDEGTGLLLASNPYSLEYPDAVAFMGFDAKPDGWTTDRAEFLGRGTSFLPEAVVAGAPLSGVVEAGRDPCAAMWRDIEVAPGATVELLWLVGEAEGQEHAASLAAKHASAPFEERLRDNDARWRDFLGTVQVETPDPALNALVNTWLPYQALACRVDARAAFYQASGAYGFRDQLQDTLALMLHDPALARRQIVNAARRQFSEGDVQHWWLPKTGAGVRTMISDDVVWLGFAAASYARTTGDAAILDEQIPFLKGEPLKSGEHDRYFQPETSPETASIYEHCARALDLAIARRGQHGLPLMLGGDWNDGMDGVGKEGQGESVWLGWFLLTTLDAVVPFAEQRGDATRAAAWAAHADALAASLNEAGWDGEWYRRGYFDDGTPLGSRQSDECRIDSIAQSWAVLSGRAPADRAAQAIGSVGRLLADDQLGIVKLFTPPFESTPKEPGYIKAYPPGVRENGGQYSHAAAWYVLALARMGDSDAAWRTLSMMLPTSHSADELGAETYRVEPYVVAADIYSASDKAGRGGWTWYTGSAGWFYRAAVEGLLGLTREGDALVVSPRLPKSWDGFEMSCRVDNGDYRIKVARGGGFGIELDGKRIEGHRVPLSEGKHEVSVMV